MTKDLLLELRNKEIDNLILIIKGFLEIIKYEEIDSSTSRMLVEEAEKAIQYYSKMNSIQNKNLANQEK